MYFDVSIKGVPQGRITMVLFTKDAPRAAENFRQLCTGGRVQQQPLCRSRQKEVFVRWGRGGALLCMQLLVHAPKAGSCLCCDIGPLRQQWVQQSSPSSKVFPAVHGSSCASLLRGGS